MRAFLYLLTIITIGLFAYITTSDTEDAIHSRAPLTSDILKMDKEIARRILNGETYNYARQQTYAKYLTQWDEQKN